MNKLFTRIGSAIVGIAMAIGVGVAIGSNRDVRVAEAGTATTSPLPNQANTGSDSNSYVTTELEYTFGGVTYTANNVNPKTLQMQCGKGSTSSTNASNFWIYNNTAMPGAIKYIAIDFNGTVTPAYWQMSVSPSAKIDSNVAYDANLAGVKSNSTITWTYQSSSNNRYFRLCVAKNGGTVKMNSIVIGYDNGIPTPEISADSFLSVVVGNTSNLTVSYDDFTPGTAITATSVNPEIATVTSSVATASTTGTATFTVSGVSQGKTTINLSFAGAASPTSVSVDSYQPTEFTLINKTSKIADGASFLIAANNTGTIMSSQASTNRNSTSSVLNGSTITTSNSDASVLDRKSVV